MSTFFGVEIGRRALSVFRKVIDIAAHNISNSRTEGYSRQRATITTTDPYTVPNVYQTSIGQVGTGITISQISRLVDWSVDMRIRNNTPYLNYTEIASKYLSSLESIINEPTDRNLHNAINNFFNSWQQLSVNAADTTLRSLVRQKSIILANKFNYLASQISQLRSDVDFEIRADLDAINTLIKQIRDLNTNIRLVSAAGDNPNDLIDRREKLIRDLSEYIDVQTVYGANNSVTLYIGGRMIVQDEEYKTLTGVPNPLNSNFVDIKFSDDLAGPNVNITNGKIKGLLDMRDDTNIGILYFKNSLDSLAFNFITAVNNQHRLGWGLDGVNNRNLFVQPLVVQDAALNMAVDPLVLDVVNGLNVLAAADDTLGVPNIPGSGENARLIARIQTLPIIGTYTANEYYGKLISDLGIFTSENNKSKENYNFILNNLQNIRDSISGVSLDEEASFLVEYQKAYEAVAKTISIYNDIYDTILEMLD